MTEEEKARKVSKIKRINERLLAIGRDPDLGKDSEFYQRFKNAITLAIPEDARTGTGTISRSEKTLDQIPDDALDDLLKHHTAGEIKRTAREQIATETGRTPKEVTKGEVSSYLDVMDEVTKFLSTLTKEESGFYDTYWKGRKGLPRPTYSILKDMKDTREEAASFRAAGNEEAAQYVEDKLSKRIDAYERDIQEVIFT